MGVAAQRDGAPLDIRADVVVIADGGFPANAELFRKHIGPWPDRVLMRHAGTAMGDGLRMAAAAGAALVGLDRFYGDLLSRGAMANAGWWPYPQIDAVARLMPSRLRLSWWIGAGVASSTRVAAASRSPTTSPGTTTRYAPR
jgi:predicted oxidoreductase